jgi:hypothetical protein
MNLALRSDQPRKTGRPIRGGLRLAFGALVAAGLIGAAAPWSASAAPPGGIPTATPTHHPVATSTPSTTTDPSATPLQVNLSTLKATTTTGEVGNDNPYVVLFSADLSQAAVTAKTQRTIVFKMGKGDTRTSSLQPWSIAGGKAAIKDTDDVLVLAALMENDGSDPQVVTDTVDSRVRQVLRDNYHLSRSSLVSKLLTEMNNALDDASKASGINHDDRIGNAKSVSITPGNVLDAANGISVPLPLTFTGWGANYTANFTLKR